MKTSQILTKIRLSNKKRSSKKLGIIVNGVLIFTVILPECSSILSNSKLEIANPTIEVQLITSDKINKTELHKDETYVVDLNDISINYVYGQEAIGGKYLYEGI